MPFFDKDRDKDKDKDKSWSHLWQSVAVALLVGCAGSAAWASNPEASNPDTPDVAELPAAPAPEASQPPKKAVADDFRPRDLERSFLSDQKAIWTSPFDLHLPGLSRDGESGEREQNQRWLVPFAIGTVGLIAADRDVMRHLESSPLPHSNSFGNYGLAAMAGTAAALYLRGAIGRSSTYRGTTDSDNDNDSHSRETGFLAGEAALNAILVGEGLKFVFERPRPGARNAGSFGAGGNSFPSEHALAAWSIASVMAHEYPGTLTRLLAYGAASGISLSRVAARQHFPSDVVVGSALGYLIGRYVYRSHHDPELPGARIRDFEQEQREDDVAEKAGRPRTPPELGSPYVPVDSWVYAAFDRLAALGYAPSAYANLRPWTRMECARILTAASADLAIDDLRERGSEAYRLYAALQTEFAHDLLRRDGAGTSSIQVDSIYTRYLGIAGTPLDDSYHFGETLINDFGRLYGPGSNLVSGASASGSAGPFAFYVRGEYQHAAPLPAYSEAVQQLIGTIDATPPQMPIHTSTIDRFRLVDAYAAFNFKTMQLSAGRQSLWWGPDAGGAPNLSNNAEPIDMLRLTNPSPWRLPTFFHWLGPMRWDFFFGLMAGHHYPPGPAIDGQKLSFKPTPNLEFGFSRTIVFKPVTFGKFWSGFISVGNNLHSIPGTPAYVGDRRGGFDFSYRIPGLRHWLVVYSDGMSDDNPSPLAAPQRSLMNPGFYLPQIPRVRKLDFRAELAWSDPPLLAHQGGRFFYYDAGYRDCYTNDQHLIGSWVGREGHGVQLWSTYWFRPRRRLEVGYRKAHIDSDFIPAGGNIQDFLARATWQLRPEIEVAAFLQYERWNFPVLSPLAGPDTVASVELTYHPQWRKGLSFQ